jgi:NADPH:quinone reductase-like Zn-dependent oxidoreductase
MKKLIFNTTGKPEHVLALEESATPIPQVGEVLVKVKASPINPSDIAFIEGVYGIRPQLPSGAGFEGAGIIEAVGEGVHLPIGAKVSFTTVGTWSEYASVSAKSLIPLPDAMPFETACQVFVNPFTAWAMVHESGLKAGDWLLLTAGGSTFAQLVIQIASKRGIKVICTVRRNEQMEQLKALGATEVINTEEANLVKKVRELTDKKGVSYCFDAVGGDVAGLALQCLAYKGTLLIYGMLSQKETPVNNGLMIFKNLQLRGFWLSSWLQEINKEVRQQAANEVIEMLNKGELKVKIDKKYALTDFREAIIHAQAEGRTGKILLTNE